MSDETSKGSLKCVVGVSPQRALGNVLAQELSRLGIADQRPAGEHALIVHAEASTAEIRDALAAVLDDGESVLVCEFERWSSYRRGVDGDWLRRRGH